MLTLPKYIAHKGAVTDIAPRVTLTEATIQRVSLAFKLFPFAGPNRFSANR